MQKINKKNINVLLIFQSKNNKKGFTIMEALIGVFIISVALVSFLAVMGALYKIEFGKRDYVVAANLAQEGIEIVRNIRDNNWKAPRKGFAPGFFPVNGPYCVDYLNNSRPCNTKLQVRAANGSYAYNGGANTRFEREILIAGPADKKTITSTVKWRPVGTTSDITIQVSDILSDWADAN